MPESAEIERYKAAWKARRQRFRTYYAILAAAIAVLVASSRLPVDSAVVGGFGIVVILCATFWVYRFRCPRCGEVFWSQWLQKPRFLEAGPQACEHCGLRLNEVPEEKAV